MKYIPLATFFLFFSACVDNNTPSQEISVSPLSKVRKRKEVSEIHKGVEHPLGCDFSGYVKDCTSWNDINGKNYLLRANEEPHDADDTDEVYGPYSQFLHVYHYLQDPDDPEKMALKREILDYQKNCEFDLLVDHLDPIEITDLDKDGIAEATFIYRIACRSDVSPANQKLIILEDGKKYVLRGRTFVEGNGGDYTVDAEFKNAPKEFLDHAEVFWKKNRVESW